MKNVEYQTRQLIREIKRSNVYNQYRRLQMKIVRDEALNEEYKDILQNSDVIEFLTAEQSLAMMMNRVTEQIYNSLDFDISFLDS